MFWGKTLFSAEAIEKKNKRMFCIRQLFFFFAVRGQFEMCASFTNAAEFSDIPLRLGATFSSSVI